MTSSLPYPNPDNIPVWPKWLVVANEIVYWRSRIDDRYFQISLARIVAPQGGYRIHLREFRLDNFFSFTGIDGVILLNYDETLSDYETAVARRWEVAESLETFIVLEAI